MSKTKVKLENITISQLKEMIKEGKAHNDESLMQCLKRFQHWYDWIDGVEIVVRWLPYWNEFQFVEYTNGNRGIVGGVIFHGYPDTGYQENFSVQITPSYGWQIHT